MAKATSPRDTPMMRQYLATKAQHPEALLFMRMGDFYELFFDDAVTAAQVLGITLTCRNKGAEEEVPMAGVPWRSLGLHLPKALAAGWKVAVMDQLEDPKDAKGLVERGLTRVITAGTLIDEDVLDAAQANWLVAITALDAARGPIGVAALDVSTGAFQVEEASDAGELALALARLQPAELLVPEDCAEALAEAGLFIGKPPRGRCTPRAGRAAGRGRPRRFWPEQR
jgi:DNA mismatch repair protein MutS